MVARHLPIIVHAQQIECEQKWTEMRCMGTLEIEGSDTGSGVCVSQCVWVLVLACWKRCRDGGVPGWPWEGGNAAQPMQTCMLRTLSFRYSTPGWDPWMFAFDMLQMDRVANTP